MLTPRGYGEGGRSHKQSSLRRDTPSAPDSMSGIATGAGNVTKHVLMGATRNANSTVPPNIGFCFEFPTPWVVVSSWRWRWLPCSWWRYEEAPTIEGFFFFSLLTPASLPQATADLGMPINDAAAVGSVEVARVVPPRPLLKTAEGQEEGQAAYEPVGYSASQEMGNQVREGSIQVLAQHDRLRRLSVSGEHTMLAAARYLAPAAKAMSLSRSQAMHVSLAGDWNPLPAGTTQWAPHPDSRTLPLFSTHGRAEPSFPQRVHWPSAAAASDYARASGSFVGHHHVQPGTYRLQAQGAAVAMPLHTPPTPGAMRSSSFAIEWNPQLGPTKAASKWSRFVDQMEALPVGRVITRAGKVAALPVRAASWAVGHVDRGLVWAGKTVVGKPVAALADAVKSTHAWKALAGSSVGTSVRAAHASASNAYAGLNKALSASAGGRAVQFTGGLTRAVVLPPGGMGFVGTVATVGSMLDAFQRHNANLDAGIFDYNLHRQNTGLHRTLDFVIGQGSTQNIVAAMDDHKRACVRDRARKVDPGWDCTNSWRAFGKATADGLSRARTLIADKTASAVMGTVESCSKSVAQCAINGAARTVRVGVNVAVGVTGFVTSNAVIASKAVSDTASWLVNCSWFASKDRKGKCDARDAAREAVVKAKEQKGREEFEKKRDELFEKRKDVAPRVP